MTAFLTVTLVASVPGTARAVADDDWLGIVNTYRAMSGLAPVTENGEWSAGAQAHSCYMLQNGISHDEDPSKPLYSAAGDVAGNSGNVAVSSSTGATPRNHIELWMTGPFHAIGILRHNLRTSGFGLCANESTPTWHSGGTLDVLRGLDSSPRPTTPTVFPGNGATVPLHSFVTEFPNPMTMCGWTGTAGLPLIAMMPNDVTSASATLTGPSGPIPTCVLHKNNASDSTARSILDGDNAVIVMPRTTLADGSYTVSVSSDGGAATWSFNVDRDAPLTAQPVPPAPVPDPVETGPATTAARFEAVTPFRFVDSRIGLRALRLRAGEVTPIQVSDDSDIVAVSANFVSVDPNSAGYITTFNCTNNRPEVSTLGFRAGGVVANQTFVPLSDGALCLYSSTDTDVVVDINGYYRRTSGSGFISVTPVRLYDSRSTHPLQPGEERVLKVAGVTPGAPSGVSAIALNLTAIEPEQYGYVRVYPCGSGANSDISSINFTPLEVRANTVITPVSSTGAICVQSNATVDVALDLSGYFKSGSGSQFQPLTPVRMFDSRLPESELNPHTAGQPLAAGQTVRLRIAGKQGVPGGAKAASVNITAIDSGSATFVTAYPCGKRPEASNVNITPAQAVTANGALIKLSSDGDLCLYTANPAHLVVDINGVYL